MNETTKCSIFTDRALNIAVNISRNRHTSCALEQERIVDGEEAKHDSEQQHFFGAKRKEEESE